MSQCLALTSKMKRCRNYACSSSTADDAARLEADTHTCLQHKGHFNIAKKIWFNKNAWFLRSLEFSSAERLYVAEALKHGLVDIQEEDIRKLPDHPSYTYFIFLCVKLVKAFRIDWNAPLSERFIKTLWKWYGSIGPVQITYETFFSVIRNSPQENFYKVIQLYPHGLVPEKPWFKFFRACADQDWFEEILHSDKNQERIKDSIAFLHKLPIHHSKISLLGILESGRLEDWLEATKYSRYDVLKGRLAPMKDELLSIAWIPERFMCWCLDEEEKSRIRDVWGTEPNKIELSST